MGRKRLTPEDIIGHLRTVEIESDKGATDLGRIGTPGMSIAEVLSSPLAVGSQQPDDAEGLRLWIIALHWPMGGMGIAALLSFFGEKAGR